MSHLDDKAAVRDMIQQSVSAMTATSRIDESIAVCHLLEEVVTSSAAAGVMAFLPLGAEIDVTAFLESMLKQGLPCAVPAVNWAARTMEAIWLTSLDDGDLAIDSHGVRVPVSATPAPLDAVDLIVVPGIAFDGHGHRLGRGGGFYDRFLAGIDHATVGVGFRCQLIDSVPTDARDISVGSVVTADGRHDLSSSER